MPLIKPEISNTKKLIDLFKEWYGNQPDSHTLLSHPSNSKRVYRLKYKDKSMIGVLNPNTDENLAFSEFTQTFHFHSLPVPQLYLVHSDMDCYLMEDLGITSLESFIEQCKNSVGFNEGVINYFKKTIDWLIRFQFKGHATINYSLCYNYNSFDDQVILQQLQNFEAQFLKRLKLFSYKSKELKKDFDFLATELTDSESMYFSFQNLNTANLYMTHGTIFFTDYQHGCEGAPAYDLASLLYDPLAMIPEIIRQKLLAYYLNQISKDSNFDQIYFKYHFYGYALVFNLNKIIEYLNMARQRKNNNYYRIVPNIFLNIKEILSKGVFLNKAPILSKILVSIIESNKMNDLSFLIKKFRF